MPIEIKEATTEYLTQVDQLLPSSLTGGSKTIVMAIAEQEILGAGFIEAVPRNIKDPCLRIEIAAQSIQTREALVEHLSDLARSWDAESIELHPPVELEGNAAKFRTNIGFEPVNETQTWKLDLPLARQVISRHETKPEEDTWSSEIPTLVDRAMINGLFRSNPLVANQLPFIVKFLADAELLKLSRVLFEANAEDPNTPRLTAALLLNQSESTGIPFFATAQVSDPISRLLFLLKDALASWEEASIESIAITRSAHAKPEPLLAFLKDSGATLSNRKSRWVKALVS